MPCGRALVIRLSGRCDDSVAQASHGPAEAIESYCFGAAVAAGAASVFFA